MEKFEDGARVRNIMSGSEGRVIFSTLPGKGYVMVFWYGFGRYMSLETDLELVE